MSPRRWVTGWCPECPHEPGRTRRHRAAPRGPRGSSRRRSARHGGRARDDPHGGPATGRLQMRGHPRGIVKQDLVAAHQDQRRRRCVKRGEQGRQARIPRVKRAAHHLHGLGDAARRKQGIRMRVVPDRRTRQAEIGPGRQGYDSAGPLPTVTQCRQQGQGKAAPGTVAAQHDLRWRPSCAQQRGMGCLGVLEGGRGRMFGRLAVVRAVDGHAGQPRQPPQHRGVGRRTARDIGAAVKPQDHPLVAERPGRDPVQRLSRAMQQERRRPRQPRGKLEVAPGDVRCRGPGQARPDQPAQNKPQKPQTQAHARVARRASMASQIRAAALVPSNRSSS